MYAGILLLALVFSGTAVSSPLRGRDLPTPVDGETARQFLSERTLFFSEVGEKS